MSIGHVHRMPKPITRASIVGVAVLMGSVVLVPTSSMADPAERPTIREVKQRIDGLNHQAEIASEKFNAVREQMKAARERLAALQADLKRQGARVEGLRSELIGNELADYQNAGGLSTTAAFLVSDDQAAFIEDLATKAVVKHQQAGLLANFSQEQRQLALKKERAKLEVDAIGQDKRALADHKDEIEGKTAEAQDLLDQLEAEQLRRLRRLQRQEEREQQQAAAAAIPPSRDAARPSVSDVPASGRAGAAVQAALAQIGDPYVYGAAGPDAFDCSGLTMYAWAQAGVSIPHASSMQPGAGTPVSTSSLEPGDLVFYYSPISHVGMYIGNGQVVHAPHTGSYVQIVPLNSMPVNSAVRVG